MEFTGSWGVEKVWGDYSYYNTGEPAADKYAFVIDSGISLDTGDLNVNTEWSKSFINGTSPFDDPLGHGTAVASVIGAKADDHGLTGVAPGAQVVSLKVFDQGGASNRSVQNAARYAMEVILENDLVDKAVVNLSLGSFGSDRHQVIEELNAAGIQVTVAAGNSRTDVDGVSPASYGHLENVYTVSSTTSFDTYSSFTNFDDGQDEDDVDFAAPGSRIPAYLPNGDIRYVNGTSFSAPHVAGLLLMGGIQAGETYELSEAQQEAGMVPDPLALHVPTNGHVCPEPDPIYIEVPGPVVEVPIYVEVPVPVYPPQTTFIGKLNESNRLDGSVLADVIIGGNKNDLIRGNAGDDYIISNAGKDKVYGGEGADTFVLSLGDGYTIIKDFDPAVDVISLPSDDLEFRIKNNNTKVYCNGDFVARINGNFDTLA